MKKKQALNQRILFGSLLFAAALIVCTCAAIGLYYWNYQMGEYRDLAFSYTRTAARYIDGDRVDHYLESGEEDAYYQEIKQVLNATQLETELRYFYVFVPEEEDLIYIWDADMTEGACPLGYHEDYMTGGKAAVDAVLRKDPPEDILVTKDETYGYIASAFSPVFRSDGTVSAVVGVDLPMSDIEGVLRTFLLTIAFCVIVLVALFVTIFLHLIRYYVVKPIALLNTAAKSFAGNLAQDENFAVEIHTGDEIEELADSFGLMDREIRDYIAKLSAVTAEKERIGAELSVAAQIQSDMLPRIFPPFPERPEFDIYASMNPAKEVGGDFYDFFLIDDDHLGLVMADVSGKGVPAALFMMIAKMLLKSAAQAGLSPKAVLEKVNNQLCENNDAEMFVTVWLGMLEISTGSLICANAGHEYPAIRRCGGSFELYHDRHGFVLAGMENTKYREYELKLSPGDQLFVYTDGVPEACNPANELFGTDRMLTALNGCSADADDCRQLLLHVQEEIDAFVGEAQQFDDITMLSLTMRKQTGEIMHKKNIRPEREGVRTATDFFEEILQAHEVPQKVIMQVDVAVDEIFSNIVNYSGATQTTVGCEPGDHLLTLRFSDNGRPYDPTGSQDPDITLPLEERQVGGMGIFMVKKFMDDMSYEYRDGLNILTLKKSW